MFGIVNESIRLSFVKRYGKKEWEKIRKDLKIEEAVFLAGVSYPDELTTQIIEKITKKIPGSIDDFLFESGVILIENYSKDPMFAGLSQGGMTFGQFIESWPEMNERNIAMNPDQPSSELFVDKISENKYTLKMYSDISGLGYYMKGIIYALANLLFMLNPMIEVVGTKDPHVVYYNIEWNK